MGLFFVGGLLLLFLVEYSQGHIPGSEIAILFVVSGIVSTFAIAALLFSGKRPKKLLIILVMVNIIFFMVFIISVPQSIWVFWPVFIYDAIFIIFVLKSKDLKKYFEVYTVPKSQQTPKPQQIPKPQQTPKPQQDAENKTQFWVCPVCGSDIKEYYGRSYCHKCERYL